MPELRSGQRSVHPLQTIAASDARVTTMKFDRILFPIDFSEHSAACLEKSSHLFGDDRPREFHFVHVRHTPTDASIWAADSVADAQTHIDEVTSGFEHSGQAERRSVLLTGHTSTEICKYAGDNACDLIVMATHGRTGLAHMVMGSTAEQVVRHARCPVLTMRADV